VNEFPIRHSIIFCLSASTSTSRPLATVSPGEVIDLCEILDDSDDELLCEAEQSLAATTRLSTSNEWLNTSARSVGQSPGPSTSHQHQGCNTPARSNGHSPGPSTSHQNQQDFDGNVSIGLDDVGSTQLTATQVSDLPGFDPAAGKLWIYPTNYSVREYQFNIVQQALYKNTMVCLPTGLGKTFIAAVVMYNFYRWYPEGKVIFMAPTKPLVAQQIEACYNIMGIPQDHTSEMTGTFLFQICYDL